MPIMGENQFGNLKQNLISLLKDSIFFKMLPEKRSEFESVVTSLKYNQRTEKLVKEIIKFFEGERDIAVQASKLFRKGNPN